MGKSKTMSKKYSGSKTSKPNSSQKIVKNDCPKKKIKKSLLQKKYGGSKTSKPLKKSKPVEWRSIPDWTKYQASTDGEIRNFWTEKILKKQINGEYYNVTLSGDGEKELYLVHRLVALTYLGNHNNLPAIDHINNNKLDNRVENLRWVTIKENNESYGKNFRKLRAILQYDKDGNLVKKWKSMTEILKKNPKYRKSAIYNYMRGETKTAYGYIWKYEITIERKNNPDLNEKFRPIGIYVGIKNTYDFTNYGASENGNIINIKKNILMSQKKDEHGYMKTGLFCAKHKKDFAMRVHRLVAKLYIANDDVVNKTYVNHIDRNRSNNYYKNLEWITPQGNVIHACGKAVKMIDVDTDDIINIFACTRDAYRFLDRNGRSNISNVCDKIANFKTAYGYKWEWLEKDEIVDKPIITIPIKKKNKK